MVTIIKRYIFKDQLIRLKVCDLLAPIKQIQGMRQEVRSHPVFSNHFSERLTPSRWLLAPCSRFHYPRERKKARDWILTDQVHTSHVYHFLMNRNTNARRSNANNIWIPIIKSSTVSLVIGLDRRTGFWELGNGHLRYSEPRSVLCRDLT